MRYLHPVLVVVLLLAARPAGAALGGAASAVPQDGAPVIEAHRLRSTTGVAVREQVVVTATGATVHEFSSGGVVFALRWSGPRMPDLSRLLGAYFPRYLEALRARRGAGPGNPVRLKTRALVVHAGGHMRAFHGSAYAPDLVPPGVNLQGLGVEP